MRVQTFQRSKVAAQNGVLLSPSPPEISIKHLILWRFRKGGLFRPHTYPHTTTRLRGAGSGARERVPTQKMKQLGEIVGTLFCLALPYGVNGPAKLLKLAARLAISLHVRCELLFPKGGSGLRCARKTAPRMAVPKAAVDENDNAAAGQHNVGLAGKSSVVKSEG